MAASTELVEEPLSGQLAPLFAAITDMISLFDVTLEPSISDVSINAGSFSKGLATNLGFCCAGGSRFELEVDAAEPKDAPEFSCDICLVVSTFLLFVFLGVVGAFCGGATMRYQQ